MNRRAPGFAALAITAAMLLLCDARVCRAARSLFPEAANPVQEEEQSARKFDEFKELRGDCDLGARLDNLAIQLMQEPEAAGHVIVYTGKYDMPGRILAYRERITDYLVNARGIAPKRLTVVDGGYRDELVTELWIVPNGAARPEPADTINVNKELDKAFKFDERFVYLTDDSPQFTDEAEAVEETAGAAAAVVDEADANQAVEEQANAAAASEQAEGPTEAIEAEAAETPEEETDYELAWVSESYARALHIEEKARGCIIFYADRESANFSRMQAVIERGEKQLAEKHGVKAERLTVIFGGYRETPTVELWLVPKDASLPVPTPELEKKEKSAKRGFKPVEEQLFVP